MRISPSSPSATSVPGNGRPTEPTRTSDNVFSVAAAHVSVMP